MSVLAGVSTSSSSSPPQRLTITDFDQDSTADDTELKIRIQAKWYDDRVELIASNSTDTWTASVRLSAEDLDEFLSVQSLSLNEYVDNMMVALTGGRKFKVSFDQETSVLTWSEDCEGFTVVCGKIPFERVNSFVTDSLIFSLLGTYKDVLNNSNNIQKLMEAVSEENSKLQFAFKECIRVKNEMETELYAKFAAVLNEKNKYIAKLIVNSKNNTEPVPGPSTL